MSKIYLKVPSKPAAEFVSHGNFETELPAGEVIAVEDRRFADFLVRDYALAEVDKPKAKTKAKKAGAAKKSQVPGPKAHEPVEEPAATDTSADNPPDQDGELEGGNE